MPDPISPDVVINLITHNPKTDEVTFVIVETEHWGKEGARIPELRARLDAHLKFVLTGSMSREYPNLAGKRVRFRIDSHVPMGIKEVTFLFKYRTEELDTRGIMLDVHEVGVRSFLKRNLRKKY